MKLEVLLSCMNKEEFSIIDNSNLKKVRTLIVNQSSNNDYIEIDELHRVINTTTKGLSVSRNIAIKNAKEEICLLSDDDEIFYDDLEQKIVKAYNMIDDADIIIFKRSDLPERFNGKIKRLRKYDLLKVSSVQISFKRKSVANLIGFDPLLGAGTSNGSGEENKFLLQSYKRGLHIYYVPIEIMDLKREGSTWFNGFNEGYFYNRGAVTRYVYGFFFAVLYAVYFIIAKRKLYRNNITVLKASGCLIKGMLDNKIKKQSISSKGEV